MKSLLILTCFTFGFLNFSFAQLSEYELRILADNNLSGLKQSLNRIKPFKNGFAQITDKNGKTNYINKNGKKVYEKAELISFTQEQESFPKKYFLFTNEFNKVGLVDTSGNIILPAKFDGINFYNKYGYFILRKNNKDALYTSNLFQIIDSTYNDISDFINDSLVVVHSFSHDKRVHKMGIVNIRTKKEIISLENYERFTSINWAILGYKDFHFGLFDLNGKIIIPFNDYSRLSPESDNKFIHGISRNGYNVMDSTGKVIIPAGLYDDIWGYNRTAEMFLVQKKDLWGGVNLKNEIVIPIEYTSLEGFGGDGISRATKDVQTFFLSKKNYRLGNYKYNTYNGFRMYKNNDTIGYVDQSGQIFPFPVYKLPDAFLDKELKLINTKTNKWGIINSQFKLIVDTTYDKLIDWYDGYISVSKNNKYGVIDVNGKIQIPVKNDTMKRIGSADFEVMVGDKKEVIHLKKLN